MKARHISTLLIFALLLSALTGCSGVAQELPLFGPGKTEIALRPVSSQAGENVLRAALLYDGAQGGGAWEDTLSRLAQPLLASFEAEAVDVSAQGWSLEGFDLVYPDESVISAENASAVRDALTAFVKGGGSAYLSGGFHSFFHKDFFGARRFEELAVCPAALSYPRLGDDLSELQGVLRDFHSLYTDYQRFDELSSYGGGWAMRPSDAVGLAFYNGLALAAVNQYGSGFVYYGCLLPNLYSLCGTELKSRDETQTSLSDTTMSFDRLMEFSFAAYVSKETRGYALWRVFGAFGSPAMAWEMSVETTGAVESDAARAFARQCESAGQIASFSVARNIYTYGLRAESVTYLLGKSGDAMKFDMDTNQGVYSSGTHILSDGRWLSLSALHGSGSYFGSSGDYALHASPCLADLDGDGSIDVLVGSSNGGFYFFRGSGYKDSLTVEAAQALTDPAGEPISVESFSSPLLYDLDGDGLYDLISGAGDGSIYWFSGSEDGSFDYRGVLTDTGLDCLTIPDIGDVSGDGLPDLVVGTDCGKLLLYPGVPSGTGFSRQAAELDTFGISGDFLAPRVVMLDGDDIADIAVGTAGGYVARLLGNGDGSFSSGGFIETDEMNGSGSYSAQFGSNAVPFFADINGDGILDLICGSLEYGLAYPLNEQSFPLYEQLYSQIRSLSGSGYYIGLLFFTGDYASPKRELEELSRQLGVLRSFGAAYGAVGASRSTRYVSAPDFSQPFLSAWESGLLWYSGAPDSGENAFSLPWYLTAGGERSILLQSRVDPDFSPSGGLFLAGRYDLPLLIAVEGESSENEIARMLLGAEELSKRYGYTFCMENQLMFATAAAYNTDYSLTGSGGEGVDLSISADTVTGGVALYSGVYSSCTGLRLSIGEKWADRALSVDADVWRRDRDDIYLGLDRDVRIYESAAVDSSGHIETINIAAIVAVSDGMATVKFTDSGLMRVTVSGSASTDSPGWSAAEDDGRVVFTKYGAATTLVIKFAQ